MRFLVVDDDMTICHGMARRLTSIDHEEIGDVLCAYSAEEALALLKAEPVQVLFTDIRMGGKDGLWLIEQAKAILPDLACVVISAYSDFAYARQAMRLGTQDYLIKPCGAAEMRELTLLIISRVRDMGLKRQDRLDSELVRLAGGKEGALSAVLSLHGIIAPSAIYVVTWEGTLRWPETPGLWHYQPKEANYLLCAGLVGHDVLDAVSAMCLTLDVSVGVSATGETLEKMLNQARSAASLCWFWPEAKAIRFVAEPQPCDEAALSGWIEALDTESIRQWVIKTATESRENGAIMLHTQYPKLFAALDRLCLEKGLPPPGLSLPRERYGWQRLLNDVIGTMAQVRALLLSQSKMDPVAFARRYMREHLCEPLNMAEMAKMLHMSYNHFSRLFHKQSGETFQEHLLRLRMEAAGRMLWEGESVASIADTLCYQNASNFTRSFTKYHGISPSAWKEAQKGRT